MSEETTTESLQPSQEESLETKLLEMTEKYRHAIADMENMRKRLINEQKEAIQFAKERLILEFVHPLDSLEKALSYETHMSAEVQQWAFGFKMILEQFKDVLRDNHIYSFEPLHELFDPRCHDAIEMLESDKEPGTILEVLAKGYKNGPRVLRAAQVKVAKAKLEEQDQGDNSI
ncbi:MAG: nucleotide exchange factor GrpE [Chlamydiae bacterium]|jgi:molecular chaperone GrpE|nr:nucleotide exchange factor GrpE [Chlamydiota bacterium]